MQELSRKKKPRDLNELAARFVEEATSEGAEEATPETPQKNPHAQALGRFGGKKGGPTRAAKMTVEERRESAQKAAQSRWAS